MRGASLAMLCLVFPAFGRTSVAHFRAKRAEPGGEFTSPRHESRRERAEIAAIAIQFDATRHPLHLLLAQAFGGAAFACRRACVTRVNTALVFFVWRIYSSALGYFLISPQVTMSLPPYGFAIVALVWTQSFFSIGQWTT
jgi:hypothetical protein